tara:strand:+ start:180 stop:563 length:384 start_codon:yes stop_codon:yes gene_type:complete
MYLKKENLVLAFGFFWFFYSCLVFTFNSCDLYMQKSKDGKWDILYNISESDELGNSYDRKKLYKVSLEINEAKEIINECKNESNLKMKKYGSVYNFKSGNDVIDFLIKIFFFILPYYLMYRFFIKNN